MEYMPSIFQISFSQGNNVTTLTNEEYSFELGYSPSSSDGKQILSETITLIAQGGATSQASIRAKASSINRLFVSARQRWGAQSIKPKTPAVPPVYIHVDGLRSEILNGKIGWNSLTFMNWQNGKAILPIHFTRKAFFEDEELELLEEFLLRRTLINDGVLSRLSFGSGTSTVHGDALSNLKLSLRNTTNSQRRSSTFWVGLSALPDAPLFDPLLIAGDPKTWSGTSVVTPYVWEINNRNLDIARGTTHAVILRFNNLPLNAFSGRGPYYTRVRFRITMERLSDLYTSNWYELSPQSYQLTGSLPLPPWYIPTGHGRLYLHMDLQSNEDTTHNMELDRLYLMPTDAGILTLIPHGYDLSFGNSLITSEESTYVASGHAYYTKRGADLMLTPKTMHTLHVIHSTNVIGITPSSRTTEVTMHYRPRFHTFSDQRISNEGTIGDSTGAGTGAGTGTPSLPTNQKSIFLTWETPANSDSSRLRIIETSESESHFEDGVVNLSWVNPPNTEASKVRIVDDGGIHPKADEAIIDQQEFL